MQVEYTLSVNGESITVVTDPERSFLDVLREDLHLTGAKYGCGEGRCRACTVLVDGRPVTICDTPIREVAGKSVVTIEGLADGDALHPVQEAILAEDAIQCGYCIPGMVLTAVALFEHKPNPTDEEMVEWMNGNLCRCCGYPKILAAIRSAAEQSLKVGGP